MINAVEPGVWLTMTSGTPTLRMCAATRRRLSAMRLPSYSVIETRTEFLERRATMEIRLQRQPRKGPRGPRDPAAAS